MFDRKYKIRTRLYAGQGLGNQLWLYSVVRSLAKRTGNKYGIECFWRFKGLNFLSIKKGHVGIYVPSNNPRVKHFGILEDRVVENKKRISGYSYDFSDYSKIEVIRSTRLEGNFESEKYLEDARDILKCELQVKKQTVLPANLCIVNVRGGDYIGNKETLLPPTYYLNAIKVMRKSYSGVLFGIVTDDANYARHILPGIPILSGNIVNYGKLTGGDKGKVELDFSLLQGAHKLIISNSSFSWWGAWTNLNSPHVIAPRYWDAHKSHLGLWAPQDILTREWSWLSREGLLRDYEQECQLKAESQKSKEMFGNEFINTKDWIPKRTKNLIRAFMFRNLSKSYHFRKLYRIYNEICERLTNKHL